MKYHEITCSESFPNNLVVAEFPASFPHPLEMSLGQLLIAVVEMQSLEAEFLHMAHVGILWWDRDGQRYVMIHEHLALHRVKQF